MTKTQNPIGSRKQPPKPRSSAATQRRWFLSAPVFENEADNRNSYLLNFITLTYFIAGVIVILLALAAATPDNFQSSVNQSLVQGLPLLAILAVAQLLLRSGRVNLASISFGILLWLSQTYSLYTTAGTASYSLFNYILAVMVFGLLLGRGYAIASAVVSIGAAIVLFILGNQGLLPPSNISGDLAAIGLFTFIFTALLTTALLYLYLEQLDGALQKFRTANLVLEESRNSLEQRVIERTQSLALAAEVGRSVSHVRALEVMLKEAAELIQVRFDLYYVQVYLVNRSQTYLDLEAGTGEVGQQLLARRHRLPLNTASINGRAAAEKRSIVIADTATSATFRPNPLLPHTRSEMAVPLIVGENVVGVLDMQSERAGMLSEDVLSAFEALAGQLAIAIQNANLLAETEQARAEVEKQAARLTRANWQSYLDAIHQPEQMGFTFAQNQVQPLAVTEQLSAPVAENALLTPISITGEVLGALTVEMDEATRNPQATELINTVARQVAEHIESLRLLKSAERYRFEAEQASRRLTREGWKNYLGAKTGEQLGFLYDLKQVRPVDGANDLQSDEASTVQLPLKVRDETVGHLAVLGLEATDRHSIDLANAVMERLSTHIESLRLSEQIEKRAADLATVARVSAEVTQITETSVLLQQVVDQTKATFGLYHAHIYLLNEAHDTLVLTAGAGEVGRQMVAEGRAIPLDREQSLVARAARTRRGVIINDVRAEPNFLPHPLLPDTRSELAVPMIVGDQVVGVFDVQADTTGRFTDEDASIQTTLAAQIAAALQNARLIEQTEEQRAEAEQQAQSLAALAEMEQVLVQASSMDEIYNIAITRLPHILHADHVSLALFDPKRQEFEVLSLPSDRGALPTSTSLPLVGTAVGMTYQERRLKSWADLGHHELVDLTKLAEGGLKSAINVPLYSGEQLIGALNVASQTLASYRPQDEALLSQVAAQVSAHLNNRKLFEQSRLAETAVTKRAAELQVAAQVGTAASTIADPAKLLQEVVDLTKQSFNLYHAHIYLLNDVGDTLVLAAGAGEVGHQMVTEGRSIPLNRERSLVARAARGREGVIINDVRAEPDFLPHPLLPETRSELAVPLIAGDRVLGVFDVQHNEVNRFTDDDVRIQTTMATQVAIALQNARQFVATQRTLSDLDALNRRMTREGWDEYLSKDEDQARAFQYDLTQVRAATTGILSAPEEALHWQLKVQDEVIGQLEVADAELPAAETEELVAAVAERLSVHLETLRLSEETQAALARNRILYEQEQEAKRESETRARREQILREITARLAASPDVTSVLQVAAEEVGRALNRPTYVVLDPTRSAPQPN